MARERECRFLLPKLVTFVFSIFILAGSATAETTTSSEASSSVDSLAVSSAPEHSPADSQKMKEDEEAGSLRLPECLEEQPEALPTSGCYSCETIIRPGCPPSIKCIESSSSGKTFCSITIGGGVIKCETSGPSCTTD